MSLAASYSIAAIFSAKDKLSPAISRIEKRYGKFAGTVGRTVNKMNRGINKALKIGATVALAALISFTAMATREFIELDNAVVQAGAKFSDLNTRSDTYAQSLDAISKKSREVASVTEFMASDSAGALDKMAMAGLASDVSMSLLMGTTNLATAAGTDLTTAVDIATDTMGAFALSMDTAADAEKNLNRVSDVFAKTTTTANTDILQLAEAVAAGGAAFSGAGQEIETFAAFTGILADGMLKGGSAGTSLRNVMLRLAKPTEEAAELLDNLNVKTADANGDFRDAIDILADLEKGLEGMGTQQKSAAIATIFGARTVTGINLLLAEGSEELRKYRAELINSTGDSKKMAAAMRGSLKNQIAILKSSVMELGLQFVDSFQKDGRGALQGIIEAAQNFDMKPITDGVKNVIGTLKTMNSLVQKIGGWGTVIKVILGFAAAVKIAVAIITIMNLAMMASPVTWIILGIVAAVALLTAAIIWMRNNWELVKSTLADVWDRFSKIKGIVLAMLGPVGWMINLVIDLISRFGEIKDAFTTDGIITGLLKIGQVIFESLISPFTQFMDLIRKVLPGNKPDELAERQDESREERQERRNRGRLRLAPNGAEEESKQEQMTSRRGRGTITVKSDDGTPLEVDDKGMEETGWDMEALGKDTA